MFVRLLMLGTHAHEGYSTMSVCLLSVSLFLSTLYDKLDLPACSPLVFLVFLGFQLTDFDKTVSFGK